MFAKVAIDVLTNNLQDTYTYHIPTELEGFVGVGSRVMVDFGVRKVLGYVVEIVSETDFAGSIRDIVEVLDFSNELSLEQVEMAKKISYDTNCSLSKALEAMYPAFLNSKYRRFVSIKNFDILDPNIALLFKDKKKIILTQEVIKNNPKIKKEIEKGALELDHDVITYGRRKYQKVYSVNPNSLNVSSTFTGIRKNLISYLSQKEYATMDDIKEAVGCSGYLINSLVKQEILNVEEKIINVVLERDKVSLRNVNFSFDKKSVKDLFNNLSSKPFLFYTNDDSFANDLYLDICVDNILKDKKVLIVTPTLIANYTIYHYLRDHLRGFSVLNFSSDMTNSDFYTNYLRLTSGDVEVVVTTKVGCFLPMENIGCVIVVDEANFNYISEMTPKYHVVEMMKYRAVYHNAKIILSSNPLTVENYYNYFQAKYHLLKYIVPNNHEAVLVNMYDEVVVNEGIISRKLQEKIKATLDNNKQVMLILNARGYANHLVCRHCGHVATCPKCNIPLTYYKDKDEVRCRYCGKKLESYKCVCGEDSYSMLGMGLEMVKEKLNSLYPDKKVLLVDSESMRNYSDYQNIVVAIEGGDVDIVIGTNNVLSFNNYGEFQTIGLVSCDMLLNSSDYKASYNTFSLIVNALKTSDVVIQGYNLDHYAITCAIENDFVGFYKEEIKVRETFKYPPYYEVNRILFTGDYKNVYHAANYLNMVFGKLFNESNLCLGPIYLKRIKGVQLIIRHKDYDKAIKIITEVKDKFKDKNVTFNYERYPRSFS
ncbi:MAG: primosomal protein N' [Bacilli bacterium]|nr:primosomal protein N' [Bacilli bacterium]